MAMRKRKFPSFFGDDEDDFFAGFEPFGFSGFGEIDELMNKLMEDMRHGKFEGRPGEPIVYGVNIRVGPDGKPHVQQFGNVARGEVTEEREPLVDIINHDKEIRVIAELPGVEKSHIKLTTTSDSLSIDVNHPDRKFAKKLKLPAPVLEKTAKASYKNGILEVVIQKQKPSEKKESGTAVKVE